MKKTVIMLAIIAISYAANAQNTFPATGNVGIGTTTPATKLAVAPTSTSNTVDQTISVIQASGTTAFGGFIGQRAVPSNTRQGLVVSGSSSLTLNAQNYNIDFVTGAITPADDSNLSMRITSGGNVGIGTATPLTKLHVVGSEIRITGTGTSGPTSAANVTFYDSDNSTRRGFIGDGASANTDLYMLADAGGGLNFGSNGVASKMFINTAGNVGIGTITPSRPLDVNGYVQTNTGTIFNNGKSWDISSNTSNLFINETGVSTRLALTPGGNVGIGTINPDQKLTVKGTIHSTSVLVDTNVPTPDYVFKNDYNLPSLAEIKTYTDKNHRLPGVPAAAEIEKNGLNLGEMNMVLLKKVEELTLYLIEQNKQLTEQHKKIADQQQVNQSLQEQINKLRKRN
jgi:hypothetical protein